MANEVLALVTCPFCGNEQATVHREAKGLRALYFRCYSANVAQSCGTVQIRYESGQTWIKEHMRPLTVQEQDAVVEAAKHEAGEAQAEAARKERRKKPGLFSFLVTEG